MTPGPHGAAESIRAQVISLDGLLDYDEGDTEEATMELSLAAEALQEMFSRDYGDAILQALQAERRGLRPSCAAAILPAAQMLKPFCCRMLSHSQYTMYSTNHASCA